MPKFKTFLKVALGVSKVMVPQIATIEALAKTIPALKGSAKAGPVIDMSIEAIMAAEGLTEKDFVHDAKFRRGMQKVNDGYVLIMQAIEERERAGVAAPNPT